MLQDIEMTSTTLFIFSGLPASGKTTLAKLLAAKTGAAYIRVDTVEQGLKDICDINVETEGYRLSYRLIRDNLELGNSAIADSCNTVKITRDAWENVALNSGASFRNIEIRCSNISEHESRVKSRVCSDEFSRAQTWEQVKNRYYEPWVKEIFEVDTAGKTHQESFHTLCEILGL